MLHPVLNTRCRSFSRLIKKNRVVPRSPTRGRPSLISAALGDPCSQNTPRPFYPARSRCPCLGLSGPSPPYLINTTNPGGVSACQKRRPQDWPRSCSEWPGHEAWLWIVLCQHVPSELRGLFELQLSFLFMLTKAHIFYSSFFPSFKCLKFFFCFQPIPLSIITTMRNSIFLKVSSQHWYRN